MFRGPVHGYPANLDAGHKGRFPRSRSEWIVFRSRLRFAAGVCVLAAGLLMGGGGAVAVADPGLGGSAPNGDDGTNDPVQGGPTAGSPVGNVTDTVRETIQGVTGTPGSGAQPGQQPSTGPTSTLGPGPGRQPGQQPSTGATSPKTEAGGTDTEDQKEDAGLVPADPNPVAAVPNVVAPVSNLVAPVPDVVAPVTNVVPPVTDVVAPVTNAVVTPVTDVVAPVTNAVVAPVTDVVAPVTEVPAPVSDVIAPGQDMLSSVAGAVVPLTQPPSDLSSLHVGHRRGGASRGRIGRHRSPWAGRSRGRVGGLHCVSGRAGGRQRNQGCNARCDCARSSVSAVRDGTASARMAPARWVR